MTDEPLVNTRLRRTALLFTMGAAATSATTLMLEWSSPYCNKPEDGPAYAAFGAPFPFLRFGGASSEEYDFMPHIYALDIALLAAVIWPAVRFAAARLAPHWPKVAAAIFGLGGVVLCLLTGLVVTVEMSSRGWRPVVSIANPPWDAYSEFRPIGFTIGPHYDCTPSAYWFKPKGGAK